MAAYAIPSEEDLVEAIKGVLGERKVIPSQRELKALLDHRMGSKGNFRVSGPRARLVALEAGLVDLQIHCRETGDVRSLFRCPVCGHRLKRVRNMTVFGGSVTLGYRCSQCPYWTGLRRRVPVRYVFTRR